MKGAVDLEGQRADSHEPRAMAKLLGSPAYILDIWWSSGSNLGSGPGGPGFESGGGQ